MASYLKLLFELIQRKLYPCSIVQIDTLEIIAGNFSECFLDQLFSIRRVEFFFFFLAIFIGNACWSYLNLIGVALVLKFSCDNRKIDNQWC